MSAFRVSRDRAHRIPGAAILLVLTGGLYLSAAAQEPGQEAPASVEPAPIGPPTLLVPQTGSGSESLEFAPAAAVGFTDTGQDLDSALDEPTQRLRGIEINRLGDIDPDSIGILGPESGGLGRDMWRGSAQSSVERLLPRLPGLLASASMRDLARRLLLTSATPPRRRGAAAQDSAGRLLSLRVDRLAALGDIEGLNSLLDMVPRRLDNEAIARARVEGLLLDDHAAEACQKVRGEIAQRHGDPYWRKAMVFCQIHSGEVDQAMLGVGLLREQGLADDSTFFSLIDAYSGVEVADLAVASPLHFAMLDVVGRPFPEDLTEDASPGILVALAKSAEADPGLRALAAERAVAAGILEPDTLVAIYQGFEFDADDFDDPVGKAEGRGGPRSRALLYQAIRGREAVSERAELLRAVLDHAERDGRYEMAVRVFLPALLAVPASPEMIWFAEAAGRALYAAGRYDAAGKWLLLARQEAIIDPQAAAALTALWPYSRLAGRQVLAWAGNLEVWREARAQNSAFDPEQIALLRSAFMALGESDSMTWIDLVAETERSTQPMPDAALLYALQNASEMRRLGETVLLGLLVLGEAGPAESHPLALNSVLRALREVGLEREARALAIEAAIAKGI